MVRSRGHLDSEETNEAAWVATRGAVIGGARWGLYSAIAGGIAYAASPIYRGLTIQFKVFLQMSGMVIGSMIEADSRLRQHEWAVRQSRKVQRDAAVWKRYEEEFDRQGMERPGMADPRTQEVSRLGGPGQSGEGGK